MEMNRRLYNFIRGVGMAFNMMPRPVGNLLGDRYIPRSAAEALRADWGAVGRDLEFACRTLAETMIHEQRRIEAESRELVAVEK